MALLDATISKKSQIPAQQSHRYQPIDMQRVATIILGGGQGTRLFPLTKSRCKPAMCYGGSYRIVDIPISNAINSGCRKIYLLTQFLSRSLHQHIFATYCNNFFSGGFIELLSAEEKHQNKTWYKGTADAVRQNLDYFLETPADYFLILSGDQLYNMDFKNMLHFAQETEADVVVSCLPVCEAEAKRMGVMHIDRSNFITSFHEKPQSSKDLNSMRLPADEIERLGIDPFKKLDFLGSMGIYLFKRQALINLLKSDPREDFGKHLIPTQVLQGNIAAYIHQGYWEDIGTIESFYKANMLLTSTHPPFNCYNEDWPLFANHNGLPGARLLNTHINVSSSILCEGSIIEADEISHSIIGPRSIIKKGCIIRNSYLMGNDSYKHAETSQSTTCQIGENCVIQNAIIDKRVCIGDGVQLINKEKLNHYDSDYVYIRDGVIVIPQGTAIPSGFVI